MTTQPEALRLADDLEIDYVGEVVAHKAAAELRRLHAANLHCVDWFNACKAERDELLEALRHYTDTYCEGWCKESCGSFDDCGGCRARAAIAKAEGGQP